MGDIATHTLDNGLTLLLEPMTGVASVGLNLLMPAGVASQPHGRLGVAPLVAELIMRGAGDLDSRQHSEALETLGVRRNTDVRTHHLKVSATLLGDKLDAALPLVLDMVTRPTLPEAELEPARQLAIQEIEALQDEPQQRVFHELRRRHLPEPINRSTLGTLEGLAATTIDDVKKFQDVFFRPRGSVLSLAGAIDPDAVIAKIESLLADWSGSATTPDPTGTAEGGTAHIEQPSAQQHIGLAYTSVPETDPTAMLQRTAVAVLSGGMSGRLFTEVREKRGLCYSVFATYAPLLDRGVILAYAGTTTERATETLEVLTAELHRISEGVEQAEFDRAIVGMKSRVVMQGESTGARAAAIASDQILLGRPRPLDELATQIDAVTLDALNDFVKNNPPSDMTTVTIGPEPLVDSATA